MLLLEHADFFNLVNGQGLHCDFACLLYKHLQRKLDAQAVYAIITEAVVIEKQFIEEVSVPNVAR